jgi:hypothetical protein
MLLHPLGGCGAPIRQDRIETSAKSEVVTICLRQFAGEACLGRYGGQRARADAYFQTGPIRKQRVWNDPGE